MRSRLSPKKPINQKRLLKDLQLLQLNPLIASISAELAAGTSPATSVLEVQVREAKTFDTQLVADNGRTPSVGSFRRRLQLSEANLLGLGDGLSLGYSNTDGSNGFDIGYTLPVNSRNGTVSFAYGNTSSDVIEPPFNALDIALRIYIRTVLESGINTVAKVNKLIPSLPHPIFQYKPPMFNLV